jgi:hypothetical protein
VVLFATLCAAGIAAAQPGSTTPIVLNQIDDMDFDRPESWAMKYFTSLSLLTGLGTPKAMDSGSLHLAFEGGIVPSLSEEERRVGFIGSKVEDLNRTSLFGRIRVTLGLPHDLSLTVGATPPVEVDGVTPKLLNIALGRPILDSSSWRLGLRFHGQTGTIEGDLVCPVAISGIADPRRNPDACHEPSRDEVTQDYLGLEISATPKIWGDGWEPHIALSVNYLDLEFQVRARYSVFLDRAVLRTNGYTYSVTAGLGYSISDRLELSGEIFYSPLDVVRSPRGATSDDLVNARLLLDYRMR